LSPEEKTDAAMVNNPAAKQARRNIQFLPKDVMHLFNHKNSKKIYPLVVDNLYPLGK